MSALLLSASATAYGTAKKYGIKKSSFDRHKATLIAVKFIEPIFDAEYRQYAPGKYRFIFDWKSETAPQIGVHILYIAMYIRINMADAGYIFPY